jgi:phospholipase/carboxylesterase
VADLTYLTLQQDTDPTSVLIGLHGIGGNEQSIAPTATGVNPRLPVISVRAPLQMGPVAFGWYPTQFGPEGPVIDADEAEQGRRALVSFIETYRAEHQVQRLYLMGFSQGAIMAVAAALSAPSLIQGAVGFSGRFPKEYEGVVRPRSEVAQARLWIGHGTEDDTLPIHLGRAMRDSPEQFGAVYEYSEFTAGHQVTPEMLAASHQWFANQLPFDGVNP